MVVSQGILDIVTVVGGVLNVAAAILLGIGVFKGRQRSALAAFLACLYMLAIAVLNPISVFPGSPTLSAHGITFRWGNGLLVLIVFLWAAVAAATARAVKTFLDFDLAPEDMHRVFSWRRFRKLNGRQRVGAVIMAVTVVTGVIGLVVVIGPVAYVIAYTVVRAVSQRLALAVPFIASEAVTWLLTLVFTGLIDGVALVLIGLETVTQERAQKIGFILAVLGASTVFVQPLLHFFGIPIAQ